MRRPIDQTYALRLRAEAAGALCGEIEHVPSGERRGFHDGPELIDQLRQLQAQVLTAASAPDVRR